MTAMDIQQRDDLIFPQSLPEFQRLFPDDAACAAYLERARWPDGFICSHCGAITKPFRISTRPGVLECRACRCQRRLKTDPLVECAPVDGQVQAAVLVRGRALRSSYCLGLR